MSKTMDTNLKFTTDTESTKIGDDPNNFTTTTGTSSSTTSNYSSLIGCKYYLPCGRCDKMGGFCTHYMPQPDYPHPWWTEPYYTTNPWPCGPNDNNVENK